LSQTYSELIAFFGLSIFTHESGAHAHFSGRVSLEDPIFYHSNPRSPCVDSENWLEELSDPRCYCQRVRRGSPPFSIPPGRHPMKIANLFAVASATLPIFPPPSECRQPGKPANFPQTLSEVDPPNSTPTSDSRPTPDMSLPVPGNLSLRSINSVDRFGPFFAASWHLCRRSSVGLLLASRWLLKVPFLWFGLFRRTFCSSSPSTEGNFAFRALGQSWGPSCRRPHIFPDR